MGLDYIDEWSFFHFASGFILTSTLLPSHPTASLVISNIGHLLSELTENNYSDTGEPLENTINHMSDITVFLIGSLLGYFFGCHYYNKSDNQTIRWIILIIMGFLSIHEVMREIFPLTWPISPAFKRNLFFGYDVLKGN
jgi:hypothetical protein